MDKKAFEIILQIRDSVQSLKFCQEELIPSLNKCVSHLSLKVFRQFISAVPLSVQINFTGVIELFGAIEAFDCIFNKGDDLFG
jgi:hypothetical protein